MTERMGPGERVERARARRLAILFGAMMLLGGVVGGVVSILGDSDARTLPAAWAIALAVLYVGGAGFGSWYFYRRVDEIELRDNVFACNWGLYFYVLVYPVWFFLWKGGLVGEPDHQLLFVSTTVAVTLLYFWKKIRP